MAYTIKEASEKMNIPAHTIRYYEKEGLLPFLKKMKMATDCLTKRI